MGVFRMNDAPKESGPPVCVRARGGGGGRGVNNVHVHIFV